MFKTSSFNRIKKILFLCLFGLVAIHIQAQYTPDILGDNYISRHIRMPDDYEGEVVCTVIKKPVLPDVKQAILYIHGYNDYFFQQELGDSINAHNYNFYALDLRKYGRSILPNQDPFYCKDISEYFADIDTTLSIIRSEGNERIILMAHSTGGLITPLFLNCYTKEAKVDALILNSPFLDMNMGWFVENIGIPVVSFLGNFFPEWVVMKNGLPSYAESLLKEYKGEWDFNTEWKIVNGHPQKAGWLRAIHQAHNKVQKGLNLPCPILILSSDKSFPETEQWFDNYLNTDIVLDVKDIQKYGMRLGKQVTYKCIPNGIHDLILSPHPARDEAYYTIFDWLKGL